MNRELNELIEWHNEILDTGVGRLNHLEKKLKTSCLDVAAINRPLRPGTINARLARWVLVYIGLFVVLFWLNFFLVKSFQKESPADQNVPGIAVFYAAVPGSITSAYGEVSNWEK